MNEPPLVLLQSHLPMATARRSAAIALVGAAAAECRAGDDVEPIPDACVHCLGELPAYSDQQRLL